MHQPSTKRGRRIRGTSARSVIGIALMLGGIGATAFGIAGGDVGAHGSTAEPPSRTYTCRFLQPDSPRCAAAWAAEPQALYDWMEVNIGDAAGRHQELIPDGELCSAGRDKFAAFDVPGDDWPATELSREADGHTHLLFEATAPHATEYFRYYLTREGYDPLQPLRWDDLQLVYDSGALSASPEYHFDVSFPERTGRHIIYMIWQRSDSPEAFYSCSDVTLAAAGGGTTTTSTVSPTTAPPTTVSPTTTSTVPTTTAPPTTTTTTTTSPVVGDVWESDVAYVGGDEVVHDGVTYTAKWWSRGFRPDTVVVNVWDSPWRVEAPPVTTPPTTTTTTSPVADDVWQSDVTYVGGDQVVHGGATYTAKWWSLGFRPDTVVVHVWDTPWQLS